MEVRTVFTKRSLPALFKSLPFQVGNLAATFSINGCTSSLPSFLKCKRQAKIRAGKALDRTVEKLYYFRHIEPLTFDWKASTLIDIHHQLQSKAES